MAQQSKVVHGLFWCLNGSPKQRKLEDRVPLLSHYLYHRFGIAVYLYYGDIKGHKLPHVHVRHQGKEAVVGIPDGLLIEGEIDSRAMKKVRVWIEMNSDELKDAWENAANNKTIRAID